VAVLTPTGLAQKAGQALGCADDGAQAVADESGIGGIVDVDQRQLDFPVSDN
jgi:hypothetical protein